MKTEEPETIVLPLVEYMTIEEELELLFEEAYMRACELDSPNSYDFDTLVDEIYEKLKNEYTTKT